MSVSEKQNIPVSISQGDPPNYSTQSPPTGLAPGATAKNTALANPETSQAFVNGNAASASIQSSQQYNQTQQEKLHFSNSSGTRNSHTVGPPVSAPSGSRYRETTAGRPPACSAAADNPAIGAQYQAELFSRCARGDHQFETKFGMCGIITAVCCFPIGLVCLFMDTERQCARCGTRKS